MVFDLDAEIKPPTNRFYCENCDTDFDSYYEKYSTFCPLCEKLVIKYPHCGNCGEMLGSKSKGVRCGHCYAYFTNTEQFKNHYENHEWQVTIGAPSQ